MIVNDNIQAKSLRQAIPEMINVGTFQYQDGQVSLLHDQQKPSHFFFTPLPHVETNRTECYYNDLSDHHELLLTVSLYTPHLLQSIKRYIKQHQTICRSENCDVSLLPIHSIRLFQKGLRTNDSQKKYTVDTEWHSNKQLRQSIKFTIYTSNTSVCENLRNLIVTRCHLSSLEVHYQLHGQRTVTHKLDITTEDVTSTSMYHQIRSQFPSDDQDTVALVESDFKNFLTDIMNHITQRLTSEEDYEGLQDSKAIEQTLTRKLQSKQMQLKTLDDYLWNSLYWSSDLTRPDRLSKVLNKIIKQDSKDSSIFHYDHSQMNEHLKQQLNLHEKQKLITLEKYLATLSSNNDPSTNDDDDDDAPVLPTGDDNLFDIFAKKTNNTDQIRQSLTTGTMPRKDAVKLVNYISEHVQLVGNTITPKTLNIKLIKFGSLVTNTTLFSGSVLLKTRANIHILPLRCPHDDQQNSPLFNSPAEDEDDDVSNSASNVLPVINDLDEKINNLNHTILQLTRVIVTFSQLVNSFVTTSDTRLDQKLNARFSQLETLINLIGARLMQRIQQSGSGGDSTGDEITNPAIYDSTGKIQPKKNWRQYGRTVAGGNGQGDELNQFNGPRGIFIDDDKTIYAVDNLNHRVLQWKHGEDEGRVVAGGNGQGNRTDQLQNPTTILVDKQTNTLIVCDPGNKRVMRWSLLDQADGQVLYSDISCWGLAMDKDRSIYVSDYVSEEVRRWKEGEEDGQIIAGGNGKGDELNQLSFPSYIFVDDNYSLYITDTDNNRVMKWMKSANEGILVAGGNGRGISLTQLSLPFGVTVDDEGQVYVADFLNSRVVRWSKGSRSGEIVVGGKSEGDLSNQFKYVTGLSFDANENLYVADWGNERIQKFEKNVA